MAPKTQIKEKIRQRYSRWTSEILIMLSSCRRIRESRTIVYVAPIEYVLVLPSERFIFLIAGDCARPNVDKIKHDNTLLLSSLFNSPPVYEMAEEKSGANSNTTEKHNNQALDNNLLSTVHKILTTVIILQRRVPRRRHSTSLQGVSQRRNL
jgi:hypothetical protein